MNEPNTEQTASSRKDAHARGGRTFAALRYPNYRLWFQGQIVSLFGTWMQNTAQGFLVFELTHSPVYLGYVGFAMGVPTWLLTLYGGVVADRMPRRKLMVVTQSAMMVFAFALAVLAFLHLVQPWHVILSSFLLGIANSFDAPARQAFVTELVDRADLTNAIALNSMMFHAATALGPAAAGAAYALLGPAWCFALNGLSFIAVIAALLRMRLAPFQPPARGASRSAELFEGVRYVASSPIVRTMLLVVAVNSAFVIASATLFPAWSVTMLHGGPAVNGFLFSARGAGAMAAALLIASLGRTAQRGRLLTIGSLAAPVLLMLFAPVRWLPLSLVLLAGIGMTMILVQNLANAIVQTNIPDALRGRVMGAYSWIFFGIMPLGAMWTGFMGEHLGLTEACFINGVIALCAAGAVRLLVPEVRSQ